MVREQLLIYFDMAWLGISGKFHRHGKGFKHGHEMLYVYATNTALRVCSCLTSHHPKLIIIGWDEMEIE